MGDPPDPRPEEPRSYQEIEVISPGERRPRRGRDGAPSRLDAEPISPDGAGVKP